MWCICHYLHKTKNLTVECRKKYVKEPFMYPPVGDSCTNIWERWSSEGCVHGENFLHHCHCHLYGCVLNLFDQYCWIDLHWSGLGKVATTMSSDYTLSSIVYVYDASGALAQAGLKSNNSSDSLANLSKTILPDKDCCMSQNLLLSNWKLTNLSR